MNVPTGKSGWITTLFSKRDAQVSTVAVVESDDPKRLKQLLITLEERYKVFVWSIRGLYRVKDGVRTSEVTSEFGGTMGLEEALRYMDGMFRNENSKEPVAFVIIPPSKSDILNAFLREWSLDYSIYEREALAVVFGHRQLLGEDLLRHVIVVDVPSSTKEERMQVLKESVLEMGVEADVRVVDVGAGLNLHEFENALLESVNLYGKAIPEHVSAVKVDTVKKSGILEIEQSPFGFERIGGYWTLKEFLKQNVAKVFEEQERAKKLGLRPPRGLLFFGPGGTGKTLFARALAKELGLPFLRLKTENIVSRWYGETERSMARALKFAEEIAPCVMFIDEIDRFGRRGQQGEHETSRRTFSILLEWLGDHERKTIVVGATNRIQDLDDAFVRVGRFDYLIPVLYPDAEARKSILEVHTSIARKVPLDEDVDLTEIAERTENFSGAELEELVIRAARIAFRRGADKVGWSDFEEALASFRIDDGMRERMKQDYIKLAERYCNDLSLLGARAQPTDKRRVRKRV